MLEHQNVPMRTCHPTALSQNRITTPSAFPERIRIEELLDSPASAEPVPAGGPQVKFTPSPRGKLEGTFVAQQLGIKGMLLFPHPQRRTSSQWVRLSIDALFVQTPLDFFHLYSQIAGTGEVAVLSFGVPDVTWQRLQWDISRSDSEAFYTLKRSVWNTFCISMIRCPEAADFRVIVETVAGDELGGAMRRTPGRESKPLRTVMAERLAATSRTESVHPSSLPSSVTRSPWYETDVHSKHRFLGARLQGQKTQLVVAQDRCTAKRL
jgi:hypothetical protein